MSEPIQRATLSVAIITFNEEENIGRTLASVKDIADEIIVVDSGSTDRTIEIAKQFGAKVFVEEWKGFAAQKNSALDKCTSDWILSLDADEEVTADLAKNIGLAIHSKETANLIEEIAEDSLDNVEAVMAIEEGAGVDVLDQTVVGYRINRQNRFLGRTLRYGGLYPDPKVRLIHTGRARFADRLVHEDLEIVGRVKSLMGDLIHHQYPTLTAYIEHMNRYSSLGAEMVLEKRGNDKRGRVGFSVLNIVVRPIATFIYNYILRLGFLDGKEGLLLHLYHSVYVSWKYGKAWELSRKK